MLFHVPAEESGTDSNVTRSGTASSAHCNQSDYYISCIVQWLYQLLINNIILRRLSFTISLGKSYNKPLFWFAADWKQKRKDNYPVMFQLKNIKIYEIRDGVCSIEWNMLYAISSVYVMNNVDIIISNLQLSSVQLSPSLLQHLFEKKSFHSPR